MKKPNIYHNQSQEIRALFEKAGNSAKVMCVPIDYAKKDHMVMFCNGHGDIVRKPFIVNNSPLGVDYLIDQVTRSCKSRGINEQHVFFGGEDVGSFAANFVTTLRSSGWLVAGVNAYDAKQQRDNLQASTDRLDLTGIARSMLNQRANSCPAQSGIYWNLRTLTRHRQKLVKLTSEVRNRIHAVVDRLFPGFLDEEKSGISAFSNSSLWLMKDRFSALQIRRRKRPTLIKGLRKLGVKNPELAANKLQHHAQQVLQPPDENIVTLQFSLAQHVKHLSCLQENIDQLEKEMAIDLAQTQGAFLTSVPGIGIVLASGITSEIGNPFEQKPLNNLVSYAGIIPRVKQTGGPEGQCWYGKVAKRCNRILKNYVVQAASHMGLHGPHELMADYNRRQGAGQHADFGMARRFLRMAMCMMRTSQIYMPLHLRKPETKLQERAEYYLFNWHKMHEKWKRSGALQLAFDKNMPLGQWRNIIEQLYRIRLAL
jgi:transposase